MDPSEAQRWLEERLPPVLRAAPPDVRVYDDEAVIILHLDTAGLPAGEGAERRQAEERLIAVRREETRPLRMKLAHELQPALGRPVAWGMRAGSSGALFTSRSVPVMTRLGRAEREVLDTLVAAGVADTRSAALAYVVRAFAYEHSDWLVEVREALAQVEAVRSRLNLSQRTGAPSVAEPGGGES